MGSRLIDAILRKFRADLFEEQKGKAPSQATPPGRRSPGFTFAAQPLFAPAGPGADPVWKWFKIVNNADFLGVLFNTPLEYTASRIYFAYNADIAEVQAMTYSNDGGVTWVPSLFSADPAFLVNRGGLVLRGAKVDLYANRFSNTPSDFLLNIKRFTFDGVALWEPVVTVLSKTTATHFAIRRPYPFRNPADNTKRSLLWLENQRRNLLAGTGMGSAAEIFSWTGSFFGLCCPSCTSYDKWDLLPDSSSKTFDISGFAASLPSYVSIRGVEVIISRADTGLGTHAGYLRPDLSNPSRFTATCTQACQNLPAGACTQAHNNVTTSVSVSIQLRKAGGALGSSKGVAVGAQTLGSPTDKWGFSSISLADLATFSFKVSVGFASTDIETILGIDHPVITLTGSSPAAVPNGSTEESITSCKVYFEAYGELFVAELDASGDLVGITSLKDGLPVSDQYNGYYNAAGQEVASWREPNLDTLIHRRVKIGGIWQAETTHAYSNTDWGDQIVTSTPTPIGEFTASRKEGSEDFVALRKDLASPTSFRHTYRRSVGGVAADTVYDDLRSPSVANPAPGAEAVNHDGHILAETQPAGDIRAAVVTDDGTVFDLWFLTRAGTL